MSHDNATSQLAPPTPTLSLTEQFANRRLLVIGGTGFLGKVWWSLLLDRFPGVGRLYLVVRARPGVSSIDRFWNEIAPHECLAPLRARYGSDYRAFLEEKLIPVDGDITQPFCGLTESLRSELRGSIDAVVNASGIVNFQPPLDVALEVNAFGAQTVVDLAKDLGNVAVVHTSTCYVAGYRTGIVEETNPLDHPFPYAGSLERAHWDADREIAECLDIIKQAKHRAGDAFRQSHFLDQAKRNLLERGEPCTGAVLEDEIARVRRRFVEVQLSQLGQERAQFWGWPNTYTYTKSIGEQIIASSGLAFTIVRPAIIESCVDYPCPGWNEGVNTSAPIIYAIREGQTQLPGDAVRLDVIPCDLVASGILLSLAELLEGTAKPVYQYGTSDSNPITMSRIYELSGLYKRKYYQRTGRGGPLLSFLQAHVEGALMTPRAFDKYGPRRVAQAARALAELIDELPNGGLSLTLNPAANALKQFSRIQERVASVVGQFVPFTAELDYEFRCDNTRTALARTAPDERALLYWEPEKLDWRDWFLNFHVPGLERFVFPELEAKLRKPLKALRHHETLVHLLGEMADRFDRSVALQHVQAGGVTRVTYREWHALAQACALRLLALGVSPGCKVALVADNHPDWAVGFFGILYAGGTVVPLPAEGPPAQARSLVIEAEAQLVLADVAARERFGEAFEGIQACALERLVAPNETNASPELPEVEPNQVAVVLHSRGTTGSPRAASWSHHQIVAMLGALAPLFPLTQDDRLLNAQPQHEAMSLICGMLSPLSRGCRVVYPRTTSANDTLYALSAALITAVVGTPETWNALVDKTLSVARNAPAVTSVWLRVRRKLSVELKRTTGFDSAPLLLAALHRSVGGNLRLLITGQDPLATETRKALGELGLPLLEIYGLTETGPLGVSSVSTRNPPGYFRRVLPGIELKVSEPDATGLGEIAARCVQVNVNADWVETGDLGRLDARGRLKLVGRRVDAIRAKSGPWVHPCEAEARVGRLSEVSEWCMVGVQGPDETRRLACVVVTRPGSKSNADATDLRLELWSRFIALPRRYHPAFIVIADTPLPRLACGNVDYSLLHSQVNRLRMQRPTDLLSTEQRRTLLEAIDEALREAAAEAVPPFGLDLSLRTDVPLDALQRLRFVEGLEQRLGRALEDTQLARCDTVEDVVVWLSQPAENAKDGPVRPAKRLPHIAPLRQVAVGLLRGIRTRRMPTSAANQEPSAADQSLLLITRLEDSDAALNAQLRAIKAAMGKQGTALVALVPHTWSAKSSSMSHKGVGHGLGLANTTLVTYRSARELNQLSQVLLSNSNPLLVTLDAELGLGSNATAVARLVLDNDVEVRPLAVVSRRSGGLGDVTFGASQTSQQLREAVGRCTPRHAELLTAEQLNRSIDEVGNQGATNPGDAPASASSESARSDAVHLGAAHTKSRPETLHDDNGTSTTGRSVPRADSDVRTAHA